MKKPAVFLDRDGVINIDKNYVYKIKDFEWITDIKQAIKFINDNGYYVFVVTNQSGISRGYYSIKDMEKLHKYINYELNLIGTKINAFFYSPYHPEAIDTRFVHLSNLRKPNTGMLELALKEWDIEKEKSFLIGDKKTDIKCANKFGINGYIFDYKKDNILKLVKKIIQT